MKFHESNALKDEEKRSNDCLVDVSSLNHNQLCPKHMVTSKKIDLITVFGLLACDWFLKEISCPNDTGLPQVQEVVNESYQGRRQACMADKKTCTLHFQGLGWGVPNFGTCQGIQRCIYKYIYIDRYTYTEIKNIIETFWHSKANLPQS